MTLNLFPLWHNYAYIIKYNKIIVYLIIVRLVSNGAVDIILQSLQVYSESPHIVTDSVLVEYLSLLLQLSSKGMY